MAELVVSPFGAGVDLCESRTPSVRSIRIKICHVNEHFCGEVMCHPDLTYLFMS